MASLNLQDLTGQVKITEQSYFANGGSANIWKGKWARGGSNQTVAVKVVRKVWGKPRYLERLCAKWKREAELWARLDHPYIVPFYGICFGLGAPSTPCLVSPYFKNGNVADYIKKYPNANRMRLVSQVATGLAYMHSRGIIHGDIKSSNVLVNDKCEACIIDFGVSRELDFSDFTTKPVLLELPTPSSDKENNASLDTATFGVGGTRRWMACELLAPANGTVAECALQTTVATDIWAFGMTALEVFSGHLPFHQVKHDAAVILSVMTGSRPKHEMYPTISHHIWFLLELCWRGDPTQRPSMQSLSTFFKTHIHSDNVLPAIADMPCSGSRSPLGPVFKNLRYNSQYRPYRPDSTMVELTEIRHT